MSKRQVSDRWGFMLALGALGGALLVLGNLLVGSGKYVVALYFLLVLGVIVSARAERIAAFRARFAVVVGALAISSLALYLSIVLRQESGAISLPGHAWRFGVLSLITLAIALPATRVAAPPAGQGA
jgi:hypothetical protein